MVDNEIEEFERLRRKYQKLYIRSKLVSKEDGFYPKLRRKGGLFTAPTRKRLLHIKRKAGRDRKNANFWYDVRETTKTGLIDLQLFLETADDKNVHRVLNRETLKPILDVLFYRSVQEPPKQGAEKAKIAQLLVKYGLEYLQKSTTLVTTSSQQRMVDDAIDLSKQLAVLLLPESDRVALLGSGKI